MYVYNDQRKLKMLSANSISLKRIFLIALVVLLSLNARAQERPEVLRRPVPSFTVEHVSRIDAVLKLAKEQHLPLGIEYAGPRLFEAVTVRFGPAPLGTVVESLFPKKAGFRVSVRSGVLVISHSDVPKSSVNLLDTKLRELAIPESTAQEASLLVQMELARQLVPGTQAWAGSYNPGTRKVRIGPLHLSQVTIREALNRIVILHGRAGWIIQVRPELLGQMPPGGLWMVVEYDNLPRGFGQILQKRGLP